MFSKRFALIVLGIFAAFSLYGCGGKSKTTTTTPITPLPISIAVTASATTVDATNAVTLTAAATNDTNAAGVSWAVSGGGALSASTTTGTTYTAPAPSATALTVTVTATSIADSTKSGSATITVPAGPAISTTSLSAATVGTAYTATLAGTGAISPYTWSIAAGSTLPAGLTLNSSGAISGVPLGAGVGTTTVTFKMTDSGKATPLSATAALALTINPGSAIVFPNSSLPSGTRDVAYAGSVAATGGLGTLTYSITAGSLPTGLTMSSAGAIAGTPTAADNGAFTVKAVDAFGESATQDFSLIIKYPAVTITTATLPQGAVGVTYPATTLAATGGSGIGYRWAVSSGSSLPPGLMLSIIGVLSGKPTAAGTTSVSVTVTDSAQDTAAATFSLVIDEPQLSISTPLHLNAYIGTAYSLTMTAAGGSGGGYTWALASGSALPTGFTLSTAGVLSGNPTGTLNTSFTVTVTDSASNTASGNFTLAVKAGITITTLPTLPAAIVGGNYFTTLGALGGSGTGYTWTVNTGSTLPAGLTLSTSGVLRGQPATAGSNTFGLSVTDSASNTASVTFSLEVTAGLTITTPGSLPSGYTNVNYSQTLAATGGTGTGYSWSVTSGAASLTAVNLNMSGAGVISGKPLATGTATFTVQVTDSFADTASATFTIAVGNPTTPSLPAANPASLPSATINQVYAGSINAAGGVPPFSWTVNGVALPPDGISTMTLGNGLSVTNDGTHVLSVSGTPNTLGPIAFNARVTDALNAASAPVAYTVDVNAAGAQLTGKVTFASNCGTPMPPITVNIDTTPVRTTATDSNGNYSFTNVPNGTYTVTPSILGASSAFYPAAMTGVVVSGSDVTGKDFSVTLGYTVSGSATYGGALAGKVYLTLTPTGCYGGALGTTITAPGAFTISGVPPGGYRLDGWMDVQGYGYANKSDPSGSKANVLVSASNVTGADITLTDPATYALAAGPVINAISPGDQGVTLSFKATTGTTTSGSQIELPTSYTVQWSTDPAFISPAPKSYSFPAGGANGTGVWLLYNGINGLTGSPFTNGTAYTFRVRGETATTQSPWVTYSAPVTVGAPTGANTVSGTVTFPGTATGPLYVGFFDMNTGIAYAQKVVSPVSPQAYSVQVPSGTSYFFFAEVDQNNDGMMDPGDISNTRNNNTPNIAISGNLTKNITLAGTTSTPTVTTQHFKQTNQSGSGEGYNLNFEVAEGDKLPVSVSLVSGRNIVNPIDIAKCPDCGNNKFRYFISIGGAIPAASDAYGAKITYSDGIVETLNATVSAVMNDFATALAPTGAGASLTPTFTWTFPANAANFTYQFYITGNTGNTIWQIPGNNSKVNGFSNSVTSIVWGTDPTGDATNVPSGPLTSGSTYNWGIQVEDSNGNSTQTQVDYLP